MSRGDRVRDDIAKLVWLDGGDNDHGWETSHCFVHKDGLPYAIADQILVLPEIAVLDEDQSLPDCPYDVGPYNYFNRGKSLAYDQAQEDMADWRRIV